MSKHSDVDSQPPVGYGSVTEAQRSGYLKESVAESPESSAPGKYMSLRGTDDREGSNEYDVIPGELLDPAGAGDSLKRAPGGPGPPPEKDFQSSGSVGGGLGSSFRSGEKRVMENSMYEDHDLKELIHPTLKDRQGNACNGTSVELKTLCCQTRNLVIAFFLVMAILLAVASLGLSVLLWFDVFDDSSSSTSGTSGTACTCPAPVDIDLLQEDLNKLRAELNDWEATYQMEAAVMSADLSQVFNRTEALNAGYEELMQAGIQTVPDTFTFSNVSVFSDCERAVEAMCDLRTSNVSCNTSYVMKDKPGSFLLSAVCSLTVISSLYNAQIATLEETGNDTMRCVCRRWTEPNDDPRNLGFLRCVLSVTRCPMDSADWVTQLTGQ